MTRVKSQIPGADDEHYRWLISTKILRKDDVGRSVKALIRDQRANPDDPERVDHPSSVDDKGAGVYQFNCDSTTESYHLAVMVGYTSDKEGPIPADSYLKHAFSPDDFWHLDSNPMMASARDAACFLSGYKQ
jgi:hypothetical protein